jgi:hypothetical protein
LFELSTNSATLTADAGNGNGLAWLSQSSSRESEKNYPEISETAPGFLKISRVVSTNASLHEEPRKVLRMSGVVS